VIRGLKLCSLIIFIIGVTFIHWNLASANLGQSVASEATNTPTPTATATPSNTPTPTPAPATATLSTTRGSVGTEIRISGSNFQANDNVVITFDNQQLSTVGASSTGTFNTPITVPAMASGTYNVKIGSTLTRTFTITSSFSVSPDTGPPGTPITVRGSGFAPNSVIDLTISGVVLSSTNSDSTGKIVTTVDIPANTPGGAKSIGAHSASGNDQTTFTVTGTLSLDQPEAAPGDTVTVSGIGFRSGETGISITFDGQTVASGISADSQGSWTSSFGAPDSIAGTYTIKGSGVSTSETNVRWAKIVLGAGLRIQPTSGAPGTIIRISGSGAKSLEQIVVVIGSNLASSDITANAQGIWSTDLTVPTAPSGPLNVVATGSTSKGTNTNFTVVPAIKLSETQGFPGSKTMLRGEGFQANQTNIPIDFGGSLIGSASADTLGTWSVDLDVPQVAAGTYPIRVTSSNSSLQISFNITAGVSIASGRLAPGEIVTVIGLGFSKYEKDITLRLNDKTEKTGIVADADGSWDTQLLIPMLPSGSYTVSAGGFVTSSANTQSDMLVLGSSLTLNITTGPPGVTVNVNGTGFGSNEPNIDITYDNSVLVKGVNADILGTFSRSFIVPPSPGGNHSVGIRRAGRPEAADIGATQGFQIHSGIILEYPEGPPGNTLQILGSGFGSSEQNISLVFDSIPLISGLSADSIGSFQTSFVIPPSGAGSHLIQAFSPFSVASVNPQQHFMVTPMVSLSEQEGSVGQKLLVVGQGFTPEDTVSLNYDDTSLTSVLSDSTGSFRIELQVPESTRGDHVLRLVDEGGNKQQAVFNVEDIPPPSPSLREPDDGTRGGILEGFQPDMNWSPVNDPSGVRYLLQMSTDRDFDNLILEKSNLENPRFKFTEEDKLPKGTYFWRVKAIDQASNESVWSNSYQLKSGLIPLWLLFILGGIAIGIIAIGSYVLLTNIRARRLLTNKSADFVRIIQPEHSAAIAGRPTSSSLPRPTRRALPSALRRTRSMSPEEQVRLQQVLDFMASIPLPDMSPDLLWLEDMIQNLGGSQGDSYEQILNGSLQLEYQPPWLIHPTYTELHQTPQAEPVLDLLERYITGVSECASDVIILLRRISDDLHTAPPLDASNGNTWRFASSIVLSTFSWFRGTYLGQPNLRDYQLEPFEQPDDWDDEIPMMNLAGHPTSPFSGLLLSKISEDDALFFRDLHIQLRIHYRTYEDARTLVMKLGSTDAIRDQINELLSQIGQISQRR